MQRRSITTLNGKSTIDDLIEVYMGSPQYLALRGQTQKNYEYNLARASKTDMGWEKFGAIKLKKLLVSDCKLAYQEWLQRGVRTGNIISTIMSVVLNFGEELEVLTKNPMRLVSKMKEKQRKVMWTQSQVRDFLDCAYEEFKWRSIGLIVHMAYEFAQRVGDMRLLEWDNLNLEEGTLHLVQSKKRAEVSMPIQTDLLKMLQQQEYDFGFQKYVTPHVYQKNGTYRPYTDVEVSPIVNEIKSACGLPAELQAMDMRRTAITEMVEAGVDTTQIMSVSGHNSPNSMSPYLKHTFASANNALSRRGAYKDG